MGFNNVNVNVSGPVQPTSTYKTKVLKGNHSFASQVTEPNMKYVIKHNFDLGGESVTIPENCMLEFDGGSVDNGVLIGNKTITNKFQSIFDGDFYYNEEYHNFQSRIEAPIEFENKKCVFHNQFILKSYLSFNGCDVSGINAKVDVEGAYQYGAKDLISIVLTNGVFHDNVIEFNNDSIASISDDTVYSVISAVGNPIITKNVFKNFNSPVYKATNIIRVYYTALPKITECVFENLVAYSDGSIGERGPGSLRAISHAFLPNNDFYGIEEISDCIFKNIKSVNSSNVEVMDDCDGIYFTGTYITNGVETITHHRDYIVRNCTFVDVKKRSIKIQSQGVKILDCEFIYTGVVTGIAESAIGMMAYDVVVGNCTFKGGERVMTATKKGSVVFNNCSFSLYAVIADAVTTGTNVEFVDCIIQASNAIYFRDSISPKVKDNVRFRGCIVDTKLFGNAKYPSIYEDCVINTTILKGTSYASHNSFDASVFKNCVINFDVTDISANVVLVGYDKYINMKDCIINIYGPSDFGYTVNLFKSSYNAAGGRVLLNNIKVDSPCLNTVTFFAGITQNLDEESYIGNIDMSGAVTTQNISINTGSTSAALLKFENIKIDADNGQLLWLYQCNNLYFKNIYSTPMTLSSSGFKVGYDIPGKIYVEDLYIKPSKANNTLLCFANFETIGRNGYVISPDHVIRRLFAFDNGEVALLSVDNSTITGNTPTLKTADKGVSKFSTTDNKPIWWTGTAWVDATGTPV